MGEKMGDCLHYNKDLWCEKRWNFSRCGRACDEEPLRDVMVVVAASRVSHIVCRIFRSVQS